MGGATIDWAVELFLTYVPEAVIVLLIAAVYPKGLRQVGWKREGWGMNILVGLVLFGGFWFVGYGLYFLGMFIFPVWVAEIGPISPPFYGVVRHALLANLTGFSILFVNSVTEDTFNVFLFARLRECFKGRLIVPFVAVILIDTVAHFEFGFPTSVAAITSILSVAAIQFTKLVIFYLTGHIGALVTSHTLWNFSVDAHSWNVAYLDWLLTGGR